MSIVNIEISPFDYVNFTCRKGDSFTKELEITNDDETDFDFTGHTAKMEVRSSEGLTPVETFTTEDDTIILEEGLITLDKDEITGSAGAYIYDLQITFEGRNRTIMSGRFIIKPNLTA